MSTMDSLFLKIIDCKSRIERKLHPQLESFCESLSWSVIADGGRPPPFIWETDRTSTSCPDLGGLNKEQLIQRLFFPFRPVNNSLANPDASLNMPVNRDVNDLIDKEATKINNQNHNQTVEAKVVVDCSELYELNNNKKAGRTTRPRAASKKADCEDSFVANNLADMQNGCKGRVTRSKSRLLAKEFNTSSKLEGGKSFSTKSQSEMQQVQNVELNNFSSDNRDNVDSTHLYAADAATESISGKTENNLSENKCTCSYIVIGEADHFQSFREGSLCNAHVSLLDIQPLEGDNLAAITSLIGKVVDSAPAECQGERQELFEVADPVYSDTCMVSSSELDYGSSKHGSSSQFTNCSVRSCLGCSNDHISMLKISGNSASKHFLKSPLKKKLSENILEGEKEKYRHSVHECQSCLTSSFPIQGREFRKVRSETFTTEATRSVQLSAKSLDPCKTNDASTPDEHSVGFTDDDVAGSYEKNIYMLSLPKKDVMPISAQKTDDETRFLEFKDNNDRKTCADEVAIGLDMAEKSMTEKNLASGYKENDNFPFESHNLKSSPVHNKNLNSYISGETYFINDSKQPRKVSDYVYGNSWPKRTKMKYKSSNIIATSPRLRARPFLAINQQSECKHKTICVSETAVQNNTLHIQEDDSDFNSNFSDLVIDPNGHRQIKALQEVEENPTVSLRDEARPTKLMPSESEIHHTSPDSDFLFSYVGASENHASESLGHCDKSEHQDYAAQCLYNDDITTLSHTVAVKSNCDETMPEFEGFKIKLPFTLEDNIIYKDVDIPNIAKERAFVIEQLRLSSIIPSSSKSSIMNKIDIISDGFHSSPLDILKNLDLGFSLEHNNPDIRHFTKSSSIKLMDICSNVGSNLDGLALERSHSISSSSAWFSSESKNPPLTPVRKFSRGSLSGKSSCSATVSSIPELKCFRIDENSSTTEENADFVQEGYSTYRTSSRNTKASSNRRPISDVTALDQNETGFLSNKEFVVRDSLESSRSDVASSLGFDYADKESKIDNKEKLRHTSVIKKSSKAARTMNKLSERSKLSCESSESIVNYQNIRKGCKSSNILSNVSSFVPQILQKLVPPLQGTKDIKVKALETAEAAKRLEEQKKIEREKKKAAAKLEREKLKQENAKLLKLQQKQKEEERRKKEEDVAARKRQREEEERKVKERKRQCIEEKRTLQRECANKLHYEKDEKKFRQKDQKQKNRIPRPRKLQKKSEIVDQMTTDVLHPTIQCASDTTNLADDKIQTLGLFDEHNTFEKGVGSSSVFREPNKETIHSTQSSQDLLSYEMTPYLNSDDEDEEDSLCKKKHIPLWARRENLIEIILSTQHLDPKEIFSRKRSFNTSQVLPTHALRQQRQLM